MPGGLRFGRTLLTDPQKSWLNEHRQVLHQERQLARSRRTRLGREARQHQEMLSQIRERTARERRLYKTALGQNRWLTALADMIMTRRSRRPKTAEELKS